MGFNHEPKVRFKKDGNWERGVKKKVGIRKMGSPISDCINNERERKRLKRLFFFFQE